MSAHIQSCFKLIMYRKGTKFRLVA